MLTQLASVEPGVNFKDPQFRRLHDLDPMPGWELPTQWDIERYDGPLTKGIPTVGALRMAYVCDKDDLEARRQLGFDFTFASRVPRPERSALDAATLLPD